MEVWTIFTRGSMRKPYSGTALWLHGVTSTSGPSQLYPRRKDEDRAACRILGAQWRHFNWLDAPYRRGSNGEFLYSQDLCGEVHPEDEAVIDAIAKTLNALLSKSDIVLIPLAAQSHVDHTIVRRAAQKVSASVFFYPDLPYAIGTGEPIDSSHRPLKRIRYNVTRAHLAAWIAAVGCFATQLFLLESAVGNIDDMIMAYARHGLSLFVDPQYYDLIAANTSLLGGLAGITAKLSNDSGTAERDDDLILPPADLTSVDIRPGRAPIAVFAFRRLDHLQKTLRSLEQCEGYSGREVVIFSDAARPGKPEEALAVANVRAWLRRWCRVEGAVLVEAKKNLGLKESIVSGVSSLVEAHGRVIVLEDDLILSRQFLNFMNESLETFKDREDVVQVSGYMVPNDMNLPQVGLLRAPGSWGWGTWRRAWKNYSDDPISLVEQVRSGDSSRFNFDDTYDSLEALERNASGSLETWAVRWYASVFLRGGLTVYPARSLVRNIGFGDDGTNCKPGPMARVFARQPIEKNRAFPCPENLGNSESPLFAEATKKFYRWQQYEWGKPSLTARLRGSLQRLSSRSR